jgi:hypothetical protein
MRVCAASSSVLRSIQQTVANKQLSAVEVTQAYLQQLKSVEGKVNAFLTVDEQAALSQVGGHSCCHCCQKTIGLYSPERSLEPTPTLMFLQAAAVDAAIARGEPAGPLAGVPIAVKVSCLLNETLKSQLCSTTGSMQLDNCHWVCVISSSAEAVHHARCVLCASCNCTLQLTTLNLLCARGHLLPAGQHLHIRSAHHCWQQGAGQLLASL